MFDEEKCPDCGCEDYILVDKWDNLDEDCGFRHLKCTCPKCRKHFEIVYEYQCTGITVVSAS